MPSPIGPSSDTLAAMVVANGHAAVVLASEFDEEFKAWFEDGATDTVLYVVLVLAVIGLVLKATS